MIDSQPGSTLNLTPYIGRWIALVRGRVVGVGQTADEARQLALHNRPKEAPEIFFVSVARQIAQEAAKIPLIARVFDLAQAHKIEIYLVGGSVRDLLLGRLTHDLDFAVDGDGLEVARRIANALHAAYVPIDRERKTGRVVLKNSNMYIDIAALRGPDLLADLRDRDFTLNAIALARTHDGSWQLIDPLDGQSDLEQGILRAASATCFDRDPLRTLRAVRMCAQFNCTLHPDTEHHLRAAAPQLKQVSAERIRDEWFKILALPGAAQAVRRLDDLKLLHTIIPHFAIDSSLRQAFNHATATVDALEQIWDSLTRQRDVAALQPLQDLASHLVQRYAATVCDERSHLTLLKCAALLHQIDLDPAQSAHIAAGLAREWRCSSREIELLRTAIAAQAELPALVAQNELSRRDVYRFYQKSGPYGIDAALIALACTWTQYAHRSIDAQWQQWTTTVAKLVEACYVRYQDVVNPPPLLTGSDLIALGIEPGPPMGTLLSCLHEEQAAGKIHTREQALAYVQVQRQTQKGEQ